MGESFVNEAVSATLMQAPGLVPGTKVEILPPGNRLIKVTG